MIKSQTTCKTIVCDVIENVELPAIYQTDATHLFLGSFPGNDSLEKTHSFFGRTGNKFWTFLQDFFNTNDSVCSYNEQKNYLIKHRIALTDVLQTCVRKKNSSLDKDIKHKARETIDNSKVIQDIIQNCKNLKKIGIMGNKANEIFNKLVKPQLCNIHNITIVPLPSTSQACTKSNKQKDYDNFLK